MVTIMYFVFLSFVSKIAGMNKLPIPDDITTIGSALEYLYQKLPQLVKYLDGSPQELILLIDGVNVIPSIHNNKEIVSDIYVSPIIGGG